MNKGQIGMDFVIDKLTNSIGAILFGGRMIIETAAALRLIDKYFKNK